MLGFALNVDISVGSNLVRKCFQNMSCDTLHCTSVIANYHGERIILDANTLEKCTIIFTSWRRD
jgi:hypothetical protein